MFMFLCAFINGFRPVPHLIERPAFRDLIVVAGKPLVGTLKSDLFGTKPG